MFCFLIKLYHVPISSTKLNLFSNIIVSVLFGSVCLASTDILKIEEKYTVESLYKGHLGTWHFVLYIEVQYVLSRYEVLHLGPLNLSFIWSIFYCVLYTVSIKKSSFTVSHIQKVILVRRTIIIMISIIVLGALP